ncbi:MAG TPA: acyl-CoA dehydrogenase family protein, partial [Candidatus Bathyarchaeia archaeon]|nr:acyl-CoA dehydrogenase family protein [Candidatus Bathyarchaeia archaeon]
MIDFQLTEEQTALREKARQFAVDEVLPVAKRYDQSGEFPRDVLEKAFKAGLMNLRIPKAFGGPGYGSIESVIVVEEMAAACAGITTSMYVNELGAEPIILMGTEDQKRRFLVPLTQQFKLISFATSEPGMGSDVAGVQATCERQGGDYILNGDKFFITNGDYADFFVIFARVKGTKRHQGLCAFFIPRGTEGLSTGKPLPKLGHRASDTSVVMLRNVRVPSENLIGQEGNGFLSAMLTFMHTRPAISAMATGLARSAMEYAINYSKQREAFEQKISNFQAIQHMLADMFARVEAMRLLTWKAAWLLDHGVNANIASSCAKLVGSEDAMRIATDALQVYGGRGYLENYAVAKLFR